ncbi:MAG: SDR family oxidoreductase [Sandaracinus sp.]|nr:SDR family oxidoreductase [Sandaracinus sp.]MCB9623514.1 SDR family oxidoreductase [Sandaracinus sp.]
MTTLLTGFPTSFLAVRVVRRLLETSEARIVCVVQKKQMARAESWREGLPASRRTRLSFLEGDTAALDLGLSGAEVRMLAREVTHVHHCAAVTYLGATKDVAERANVGGAREIVELAEISEKLERLVHWSSALVSGGRRGVVLEDELPSSGFRNCVEETRARAERIVRESLDRVPATILRPSIVVGDSVTGEIDRLDGPYLLVQLLLGAPTDLRIPMPGRGDVPLNLVPIDYVVDAGLAIVASDESVGRGFHVVDPSPPTARRVFELLAEATGRPIPRGFVPTSFATTLMRTPGLERFANVPRSFLEQLATDVIWDDRGARAILEARGIACPHFEDYVGVLVDFVRAQHAKRRDVGEELTFEIEDLPLG